MGLVVALCLLGGVGRARAQATVAALPGVKLVYEDTGGTGPAIIFVHALTRTRASWRKQVAFFARAGFRVITFDRRGWGGSAPDPASGPQPGRGADDIEALAARLGLDRFHLVGIAGGGFVALDYAAWKPERLSTLVIAASTGAVAEPEIETFSKRIEIPGVTWPSLHLEVGASYIGAEPEGVAQWEAIADHARQPGAPSQPLRSPNTFSKLATIATPTLVVAGGGDLLAPPALMRLWAAKLPSHAWLKVPAAGHAINWEQPDVFNEGVLAFLRKR